MYLDLVLPLLDLSLESPNPKNNTIISNDTALTYEQALALDIWAHWSVLMFLVEKESWWIGDLPVLTLNGLLNRYGDDFVGNLWEERVWWLGSMLAILREVKLLECRMDKVHVIG